MDRAVKRAARPILVVEDEKNIADIVRLYLEREGYSVGVCATAEECFAHMEGHCPDLVILDIGLPDLDGVEVCKRLRASYSTPIIMLTARDAEVDRVVGLEVGADDYVTKPFSPRELVARVKAVMRRAHPEPEAERVQIGQLVVDRGRHEVRRGDEVIELTAKEFELLWYLCINRGLVLTREQILRAVWGYEYLGETRTIDVHIRQLRKKLGDDFPLRTRWGVGYQLRA